jgi:very-short-patch-repair endonuclease
LVVEVDGNSHATPEGRAGDRERDAYLAANGILVLRFWNTEVTHEEDNVAERVAAVCAERVRKCEK